MKAFLLKYKKEFVIAVFFAILAALMNVFVAFILKMFFDVATIGRLENFYTAVEIALVFVIFNSLVLWLAQISKFDYIKKSLIHLKNVLFEKIIGKDLNQFDEVNTGKYISIVSNDINMIEENYFNNFFELVSSGVGFLAALIVLFILSYKITFIIIGLTVLSMLIPRVLDRKISDLRGIFSHSLEEYTSMAKDILAGFEVIKSFGIEGKAKENFENVNEEVEKNKLKFNLVLNMADVIGYFLALGLMLVVFGLGMWEEDAIELHSYNSIGMK